MVDFFKIKSIYGFALMSFLSIAAGNVFLGIAALFLVINLYKNGWNIKSDYKGYYYAYGFFLITMFLSALFSGDIVGGFKSWSNMWVWRLAPFVILTICIESYMRAKRVLLFSIAGFTIGAIVIIYQGLMGDMRASAFFSHPMAYAGILSIYLPLILVMFFEEDIFENHRYTLGCIFLLGCAALLFNGTRGAWIAAFAVNFSLIVYYGLKDRKNLIFAVLLLLVFGMGFMHNKSFMDRFNTITNAMNEQSYNERLLMWNSAYNMFKDHPILGVGLDQYAEKYQKEYISPLAKEPKLRHAHNNFMQMLAENGIVGFSGFVVFIGYVIIKNIRDLIVKKCPYSLMIASSTVGLMLQGMTEYNFGRPDVMKIYWLTLGCLLVMKTYSKKVQ